MIKPLWNQVVIVREYVGVVGGIKLADKAVKSFSLTVKEIGPDVTKVAKGDKIIALPMDCHFYGNFDGVDPDIGLISEDKIEAKII